MEYGGGAGRAEDGGFIAWWARGGPTCQTPVLVFF
jgi:hypothetical protein